MPLSIEQDFKTPSGHSLQTTKQAHKSFSNGLPFSNKHNRKNGTAKDYSGGGIMAAVTQRKIQNTISFEHPTPWSPDLDTEVKTSSQNRHLADFDLGLLSSKTIDFSPSIESFRQKESLSSHTISRSNLISLSESPPIREDEGEILKFNWTTREQRDNKEKHPSSVSPPPLNRRRPLSCQLNDSKSPESYQPSQTSHYSHRRCSMYSQSRNSPHPPLPHQTQAHFFGAPNANLLLSPNILDLSPCESDYHCGFDILLRENVVLAGHQSGLEIYAISKRGLSRINGIEGLRGGVYNAKIIPWSSHYIFSGLFPLVVLVVNGPAGNQSETSNSVMLSEDVKANCSSHKQGFSCDKVEYYQTTVELYSLAASKKHIGTLLSLPKVPFVKDKKNSKLRAPSPVGSLEFRADCGNLIITSGITGETWIFHQNVINESSNQLFNCIAKIWTTVQHGICSEGNISEGDDGRQEKEPKSAQKYANASIISLNGRWLAFCPTVPSSQTSLRAVVIEPSSGVKIHGMTTQAPPILPETNCSVETPGGESVMKQIVQIGTQNFIRAGNYLAQQGIQAWTNYRSKPVKTVQKVSPTHTTQTSASIATKDPGLISILDIDALIQHNASSSNASINHLLSTFKVPHGCSFLSFSPNGLSLFTASSKGDVQFIWDLMQIHRAKSSSTITEIIGTSYQGTCVRQIAQFSRMTVARIVDVVWTSPHGERAAMVTEPGTIHILDLPASAFTWPPHRKKVSNQNARDISSENIGATITATAVATSAVNSLWTATRPLVSTRRRSSTCLSARNVTIKAGHGTQALAAGISRSVGAATGKMNEIRKSGGIKLHLPRKSTVPHRSCLLLLNKKRNDLVIALAGGVIRLYTIQNRRADLPADKQKASVKMFVEYTIPAYHNPKHGPNTAQDVNSIGQIELMEEAETDEMSRKVKYQSPSCAVIDSTESSIPHAEIEPNAPYQPFHTDKRVSLHVYKSKEDQLPFSLPPENNSPLTGPEVKCIDDIKLNNVWVFGEPIMTTKLDVGLPFNPEDELEDLIKNCALSSSEIESVVRVSDNADESEHIVITTRRRKALLRPETGDTSYEYGIFEDDCEMLDFASLKK